MSVSTVTLAIRYTGNGSIVTAYSIPFPFLDVAHIYVAVSSDGEEDAALISQSAFVVTRLADGSGGSLVTVEAVTSPAEIVIFRAVPLTQPTTFQTQGPFPARSNETALDRLLMQVQQLNRRLNVLEGTADDDYIFVPSGDVSATVGQAVWANAAARGAVVPKRAGQIGVETGTQTLWIAQSTAAGDWEEFANRFTGRIVLGLISDAGTPGSYQTAAAAALTEWDVDAALFAGDNNYNSAAGYDTDWAAFSNWINAGTAYPALGNHDLDTVGYQAKLDAKFPYLTGNRRYYTVTLGDGLVDLFVLNSGLNSLFDLVEADGNEVGSTQHDWFVAALAASRARWKIAVFHHPPATLADGENLICEEMAWPELAQMDVICCGHTHMMELLKWSDTLLVNISAVKDTASTATGTLQGAGSADAGLWADDTGRGLGRIVASQEKLTVEVWSIALPYGGRRLLHTRDARDFLLPQLVRETFAVFGHLVSVTNGGTTYITTLAAPARIRAVHLESRTSDGFNLSWVVSAGAVQIADGTLLDTVLTGESGGQIPDTVIPAGTVLSIFTSGEGWSGLDVTLVTERWA